MEKDSLIINETNAAELQEQHDHGLKDSQDYDENAKILDAARNSKSYGAIEGGNKKTRQRKNNNQQDHTLIDVDNKIIERSNYRNLSSQRFINGIKFVTNKAWPVTFLVLMSHDVIAYFVYSEDRYGNTFLKTLFGLSPNQLTITSHFGSELLGVNYWSGILAIGMIPLMAGTINIAIKPNIYVEITTQDLMRALNQITLTRKKNLIAAHLPGSRLRQILKRAQFVLLKDSDENNDLAEKKAVVAGIITFLDQHQSYQHFFLRNAALSVLANYIIATKKLRKQKSEFTLAEGEDEAKIMLLDLQDQVIKKLQTASSYYAWRAGVHLHQRDHVWLLPIAFARYAQAFFLWQLGYKTVETIRHLIAWNECSNQNNIFKYWDVSAEYECTVCDWPFVSYCDAFTPQGCLDSLFSEQLNATQIAEYLLNFKVVRNFTRFDLYKQPWQNWSLQDLDLVLTNAEIVLPSHIETLNIYSNEIREFSPALSHIERVAKFIKKVEPQSLDIHNQNLDVKCGQIILSASQNNVIRKIDLTNNLLTDETAELLANFVTATQVETVIIENIGLTAIGVGKVAATNNTITNLVLTGNDVDTSALMALANNSIYNHLEKLELGNRPISAEALKQFCTQIYFSSKKLNSLSIKNVPNFNDRHGASINLCVPKLKSIDVSHNPALTEIGVSQWQTDNGNLLEVNLGYCGITRMSAAIEQLPLGIKKIIVSGNLASAKEISQAIFIMRNKNIFDIALADIPYGDQMAVVFAEAYANATSPIKVNFSHTQMTIQGAELILSVNNIVAADLSDNYLQGIGQTLARVLENNLVLADINLKNTFLNTTDINYVIPALSRSHIKRIVISDNPASMTNAGISFAEQLIAPVMHLDQLGAINISRDQARVFNKAQPQTNITFIDFANTGLNQTAMVGFCRLENGMGIQLNLLNNTALSDVDFHNCQISAGTRLEVPYFYQMVKGIFYEDKKPSLQFKKYPSEKSIVTLDILQQLVIYGGLNSYISTITTNLLHEANLNQLNIEVLSKLPQLVITSYCGGNMWMFAASQLLEWGARSAGYSRESAQHIGVTSSLAVNLANSISQHGYVLGTTYTLTTMTITFTSSIVGSSLAKVTTEVLKPACTKISAWVSNKLSFWHTATSENETPSVTTQHSLKM